MKYFNTLPDITMEDAGGYNSVAATNLVARVSFIPSILIDPMLYYKYDIQDGDTPESIASKYYGDSYRYWMVLFANQLMDPFWEWPLDYKKFQVYIDDKYAAPAANAAMTPSAYAQTTVYQYRKTITITETTTNTIRSNNFVISQNTYNALVPSDNIYTFPDGSISRVEITKQPLFYYTWEDEVNEARRTINLVNSAYVGKLEQQFAELMAT